MAEITYDDLLKKAEKERLEEIDVVYLEEPEYTETLNCILEALKDVMYVSECAGRPKDAFQFNGVEYVKQE